MNNPISSFVDAKVVTWLKDSHGLFDYESKNISLKRLRIEASTNIYKEDGHILVQNLQNPQISLNPNKEIDLLFSLYPDKDQRGQFMIAPQASGDANTTKNQPFLVVRSLKDEDNNQRGYELEIGDVMRFGRIEYRVLEYLDNNSQVHSVYTSQNSLSDCSFNLRVKDCTADGSSKNQCRICLMDEQDSPEPLVNPCSCKGTSAHVHVKCLQNWILMKMKKKENPDINCAYWKKLNCEVCKVSLPDIITIGQERIELVPIQRPDTPYILLERLFYNETRENCGDSKMLVLLSLMNPEAHIKLGRGHECAIRENDISVSRVHASLRYQNGKFVVYDNNSKFGTLVRFRKTYSIERRKLAVQIGRTIIAFSLKRVLPTNVKPLHQLIREKLPRQQMNKVPPLKPKLSVDECPEEFGGDLNENFLG